MSECGNNCPDCQCKVPVDAAGDMSSEASPPPSENTAAQNEFIAMAEGLANVYESLTPAFDKQVYMLSKKGLLRVLLALVKVPVQDFTKKLDPLETNVYNLADRLLNAKMALEQMVLQEEAMNKVNEGETNVKN